MSYGNSFVRGWILFAGVLMTACAGNRPFQSQKAFDSHVAALHLDQYSVTEAAGILVRDGYACEVGSDGSGAYTLCTHPTLRSTAFVSLRPVDGQPNACVVEHGLSTVVV